MDTQVYCRSQLSNQFHKEKFFWRDLVERLERFKDFNNDLKTLIISRKI